MYPSTEGVGSSPMAVHFDDHGCTSLLSMANANIGQCTIAFLENYISAARVVDSRKAPKCFNLICSTATVALLYSVAYFAVIDIPGLANFCYFNSVPQDLKSNVEERLCTLVVDARVTTGIAL